MSHVENKKMRYNSLYICPKTCFFRKLHCFMHLQVNNVSVPLCETPISISHNFTYVNSHIIHDFSGCIIFKDVDPHLPVQSHAN